MVNGRHLDFSAIEEEIGLAEVRCRALERQLALVREIQSKSLSNQRSDVAGTGKNESRLVVIRPEITNSNDSYLGQRPGGHRLARKASLRKGGRAKRRSYQQPTVSSALKSNWKVSSLDQTIPFVAGQSTNKTHHLGLKMQETLSLLRRMRRERQLTNPDAFLTKYIAKVSSEKVNLHIPPPTPLSSRKSKISRKARSRPGLKCTDSFGQLSEDVPSADDLENEFFILQRAFSQVKEQIRPSSIAMSLERRFRDVGLALFCKNVLKARDALYLQVAMARIREDLGEVCSDLRFQERPTSPSRHHFPPPPTPIKRK